MLANDTTDEKNPGGFFLHVEAPPAIAELMAECPKCGATTTYGLELAWRLRTVTCGECDTSMHLSTDELVGLRDQLIVTRVRIDRLIGDGSNNPEAFPVWPKPTS